MNTLLDFLNQPIVLTIISLVLGSYLLSLISDRRARKEKLREKAIEFVDEVAKDLNAAIARLSSNIKSHNLHIREDLSFTETRNTLLTKRLSVQIKSKIYFNSDEFWRRYDQLAFEILHVGECIATLAEGEPIEHGIANIQTRKQRLASSWPSVGEGAPRDDDPPFDELSSWVGMIRDRAAWLLSSSLQTIFK